MVDREIQQDLQAILAKIIASNEGCGVAPGERIPLDADFAEVGVNSIDLLEFVLRVEKTFNVVILDEIAPDDLPTCLSGWVDLLGKQQSLTGKPLQ